jgi:hypothetical protein
MAREPEGGASLAIAAGSRVPQQPAAKSRTACLAAGVGFEPTSACYGLAVSRPRPTSYSQALSGGCATGGATGRHTSARVAGQDRGTAPTISRQSQTRQWTASSPLTNSWPRSTGEPATTRSNRSTPRTRSATPTSASIDAVARKLDTKIVIAEPSADQGRTIAQRIAETYSHRWRDAWLPPELEVIAGASCSCCRRGSGIAQTQARSGA